MPVQTRSMLLQKKNNINYTIYRGFFITNQDYKEKIDTFYMITSLKPGDKLFPDIKMKSDIDIYELYCLLHQNYYNNNMWNMLFANPNDTLVKSWYELMTYCAIIILRYTKLKYLFINLFHFI